MVLNFEEEKELENLKQEHKIAILELQHKCNMEELDKQLRIEAIKCYNGCIDKPMKDTILRVVFDENGHSL